MLASVAGEVAVVAVDHGQAAAHVAREVEGGDAGTEGEVREVWRRSLTLRSDSIRAAVTSFATMQHAMRRLPDAVGALVAATTWRAGFAIVALFPLAGYVVLRRVA
jgi:hypothetical protein